MGVFKKNPKDEYWFVPNTDGNVYGLQNIHNSDKKATSSKAEKSAQTTAKKKAAVTKEPAKSTTEKATKTVTKTQVAKSSKKAVTPTTEKKPAKAVKVAKAAPKKVEPKKAEPKKSAAKKSTVTEKATAKAPTKSTATATTKVAAKTTKKAEMKPIAKTSAAKKVAKPEKKKSGYITLTATEDIPKTLYYDEAESEKISKDATGEKIEVSEYPGMFEIKKSKDDRYVFNLYAANHVIIATSQVYSSAKNALVGINSVITNAERAEIEDQTLKNVVTVPFPKWEIYTDKGGEYRFRLSASNGSCICHSQGYTTKASCKNGIESIIRTVKNVKIDKSYLK